jgi:rhamnulokinase
VRAALENIALKYRQVLKRLEEVMDRRFASIQIIGSGTKNRLLNQLTADSCGEPLRLVRWKLPPLAICSC